MSVAGLAFTAGPAGAAAAPSYVRLAHLSPDTPAVDVYLRSESGAVKPQTFRAVAYGAMSQYLRLPSGSYQVAMRKAGAPASEKPVLTTEVGVQNGGAAGAQKPCRSRRDPGAPPRERPPRGRRR